MTAEEKRAYRKTKKGFIEYLFYNQVARSRRRGHPAPTYTRKELEQWMLSSDKFHSTWDEWISSGYDRALTPSVDRIDPNKPYSFDNICIVTLHENELHNGRDQMAGITKQRSVEVVQFTLDGKVVGIYHSQREAMRKTGIQQANIAHCIAGRISHAGGFYWHKGNGSAP